MLVHHSARAPWDRVTAIRKQFKNTVNDVDGLSINLYSEQRYHTIESEQERTGGC
jgi:hypothetical protein